MRGIAETMFNCADNKFSREGRLGESMAHQIPDDDAITTHDRI